MSAELNDLIINLQNKNIPFREYVPVSEAQRQFRQKVASIYLDHAQYEHIVNKFLPVVEWFTKTRTIDEFQTMKRKLISIYYHNYYFWPQVEFKHEAVNNDDVAKYFFGIANDLRIFLHDHIIENVGPSVEYIWNRVENHIPIQTQMVSTYESYEKLLQRLKEKRATPYYRLAETARQGLLIGDFRIGDHKDHGEIIKKAKLAVGKNGSLLVITPTRKTILNTTDKTNSWDDDNRVYRLAGNRYIDDFWLADMPEQYYPRPGAYWEKVYSDILPDLVFLGEKDHPLQPQYEKLTQRYGGILLIDPKPIGTRSGDLLKFE